MSSQIQFRCVRCQHPIQAPSSEAGLRMYCPVCYQMLTVPSESTIHPVDASQLYQADADPLDVRGMEDRARYHSLRCSVCHTNIAVLPEQAGQEIVCPECETKIIIPAFAPPPSDRNMPRTPPPVASKEVYGLRSEQPTPGREDLIPFHCRLCGTLLHGKPDQVGLEITCPDCETKTVVPPPKEKPRPMEPMTGSFEGASTFGVAGETRPAPVAGAPPKRDKPEPLVPVVCSLCKTRMYASQSEIGGMKVCPDCGRATEIRAVPDKDLYIPEVDSDGYAIRSEPPAPRPGYRVISDYRYVEGSLDRENVDLERDPNRALTLSSEKTDSEVRPDLPETDSGQNGKTGSTAVPPILPYGISSPPPSPSPPPPPSTPRSEEEPSGYVPLALRSLPKPPPPPKRHPELSSGIRKLFKRTKKAHITSLPGETIDMETLRERRQAQKEAAGTIRAERPALPKNPFWTRLFLSFENEWLLLRGFGVVVFGITALLLATLPSGLYLYAGTALGLVISFFAFAILADTVQCLFFWTAAGNDLPENEDWSEPSPAGALGLALWLTGLVALAAAPGYFLGIAMADQSVLSILSDEIKQIDAGRENITSRQSAGLVLEAVFYNAHFATIASILFHGFLITVSLLAFFPILFLSCMEGGSYFSILTKKVLSSLSVRTGLWLGFYLRTLFTTLFFVMMHLLSATLFAFGLPGMVDFTLYAIFNVVLIVFVILVYFRLLGRLAWVLEETERAEIEEADDESYA